MNERTDPEGTATGRAGGDLLGLFYSLVALEQPLSLGEIAEGAVTRSFPALRTNTPEWFAAAAAGSDLLAMAPELQALSPEVASDEGRVTSPDLDLIHVYAPEMAVLEELEVDEDEESTSPATPSAPTPAAGTQIGLLKELGDLED